MQEPGEAGALAVVSYLDGIKGGHRVNHQASRLREESRRVNVIKRLPIKGQKSEMQVPFSSRSATKINLEGYCRSLNSSTDKISNYQRVMETPKCKIRSHSMINFP